jgi:glycerol-3-phosphate dehydrogenase
MCLKAERDRRPGTPPIINAFGGKITTYRRLAESMLEKHRRTSLGKRGKPWTATARRLPGGDFPATGFDAQVAALKTAYPFLDLRLARRLTRLYGTRASTLLGLSKSLADLGRDFGADLYEVEIQYLVENEWARTAEDILWRRTKRGLKLSGEQVAALQAYLDRNGRSGRQAAAE